MITLIFIEEIEILTFLFFSNSRVIKQVHFDHRFGTTITHNAGKNAESHQDYWQQEGKLCQVYEMDLRRNVNGMGNGLFKQRTTFNENLTEFLQKYVVFGSERNRKCLLLNIEPRE
jgi:primosomal protein N''